MKNKVLLPKYIVPERYQILVKPDLEKFVFEGEETIFLELKKSTTQITLHAKELDISNVKIKISNFEFRISKQIPNIKSETITFIFKKKLPKGKAELSLKFKGILNDQMRGFYRSSYKHNGKEKFLATTQFEATDARRAFPCFDEPEAKAVFDISIITPPGSVAISNTIEEQISEVPEHGAGYKLIKFAQTPKMSTYLAAFIVGNFEFIQAQTKRGIVVRIFTTPGKKDQGKFALHCAIKALEFYENYFDIHYPLPVLDLIALPDFASAAMENWGAVTYRETALLVDKENSSADTKQWVAIVVAHELAHQWFGNLVTMKWWTHLWLNEGFASYMEYLCVNHMFPEWKIWTQYVSGRFALALNLDALNTTHPIEVPVNHPHEISEIFDSISYAKGSVVIRMIAEYVGAKNFRDGLRHYLKKHSYKNTITEDLWESLEKVSKKPIRKIMDSWTKLPGYPYVQVVEKPKGLKLVQARFFSSRLSRKNLKSKQAWSIPVNFNGKKYLFSTKEIFIPKSKGIKKFNPGETSLFRTDYPAQMLSLFIPLVKTKKIPPEDRLGLIRDAFAFAESGQLPTVQFLNFVQAYRQETELAVWEEISGSLSKLGSIFYGEKFITELNKFIVDLYLPIAKKLGFKEKTKEPESQKMLRGLVLQMLGNAGHSETIKIAKKLVDQKHKISIDVRSAVYNIATRYGNVKLYKKFISLYISEPMAEEKERIARALANFADPKLVKQTLRFAISKDVKPQDSIFIVAWIFQKPFGRDLAWNFFVKNYGFFTRRYDAGLGLVARMLSASSSFAAEDKAEEIEKFFKKHPIKAAQRTLSQVLEKIRSNSVWKTAESKNLQSWFGMNMRD